MPYRKSVANVWRDTEARYQLIGTKCEKCGELYFPPKIICKKCGGETVKFRFSGNGKIISYTTVHSPPAGFQKLYSLAIIKLEEGPTVLGMLTDTSVPKIGAKVKPVFRKISEDGKSGIIRYGIKFEVI